MTGCNMLWLYTLLSRTGIQDHLPIHREPVFGASATYMGTIFRSAYSQSVFIMTGCWQRDVHTTCAFLEPEIPNVCAVWVNTPGCMRHIHFRVFFSVSSFVHVDYNTGKGSLRLWQWWGVVVKVDFIWMFLFSFFAQVMLILARWHFSPWHRLKNYPRQRMFSRFSKYSWHFS